MTTGMPRGRAILFSKKNWPYNLYEEIMETKIPITEYSEYYVKLSEELLNNLRPEVRKLVELRFRDRLTLEQIAVMMELSTERIRQKLALASADMRRCIRYQRVSLGRDYDYKIHGVKLVPISTKPWPYNLYEQLLGYTVDADYEWPVDYEATVAYCLATSSQDMTSHILAYFKSYDVFNKYADNPDKLEMLLQVSQLEAKSKPDNIIPILNKVHTTKYRHELKDPYIIEDIRGAMSLFADRNLDLLKVGLSEKLKQGRDFRLSNRSAWID